MDTTTYRIYRSATYRQQAERDSPYRDFLLKCAEERDHLAEEIAAGRLIEEGPARPLPAYQPTNPTR